MERWARRVKVPTRDGSPWPEAEPRPCRPGVIDPLEGGNAQSATYISLRPVRNNIAERDGTCRSITSTTSAYITTRTRCPVTGEDVCCRWRLGLVARHTNIDDLLRRRSPCST